jgi:RNase P/RNase MRP subunit p30
MTYEFIKCKDMEYNRKILEKKKNIILLGFEYCSEKDKSKYLSSGLNSIMARIAAKNSNFIGIDLAHLKSLDKTNKARVLARIKQNIEICRKARAKLAVTGAKDRNESVSLIESLGGSTKQASEAISF